MIPTRKRLLVDVFLTRRLSKSLAFCEFASVNFEPCYRVYNGGGMTLRVRPRVKTPVNAKRILINTAITLLWL